MTASEAQVSAATDAALGVVPSDKPRGMFVRAWEVFAENRLALAGLAFIVFIFLFCFVGPLIYHTDQVHTNLDDYMCKPSGAHLLGCNDLGYDIMGRLMAGGQTVTITGDALQGTTAVSFGGTPATSFQVVDAHTITAVAPPGTGTVALTLHGAYGAISGELLRFTYLATDGLSVNSGRKRGPCFRSAAPRRWAARPSSSA